MKKIILLGNIPSSLINFRYELILDLISSGYTVYCLAHGYTEEQSTIVKSWGAIPMEHQLNTKGLNPISDVKATISLYKTIKEIKPDIIFPFFVKSVIFGCIAAKLANVPKVIGMIEGLGNAFTISNGKVSLKVKLIKLIQVLLYKISLPRLDKLILLNPDDYNDLIKKYKIKTKQIEILGAIGVDLNKFAYSAPSGNKHITFLFIGRLLREKGIFEFIQAAQNIKINYPNCIFQIIGSLDHTNPFALNQNILDQYILDGTIHYAGHVDNVPEWIKNADVFVLPSYREGFPRSTQEAMAIGRPIITSDAPGCRETIINGKNGFLTKPWDTKDLSEKMSYFINNPNRIEEMGIESRKIAVEKFDVYKINQKIISILEY